MFFSYLSFLAPLPLEFAAGCYFFAFFFGRTMDRSQKNRRRSFRQHLCCDFEVVAVVIHLRCIVHKIKMIRIEHFPLNVIKTGVG